MTTSSAIADLKDLRIEPVAGAPSREEAFRQVRSLAVGHYENFSVLSRLVPAGLRDDFAAVYAFCRWSDDLADETGHDEAARERSLVLLGAWRKQLSDCFAWARGEGEAVPRHAVFVALADVVKRRGLGEAPFHHLLDAFEQDQRVMRYETWDEVVSYCTRSADPVGRIILMLDGRDPERAEDAELFRMSDATCTALQLTNFWQDVRRDLVERDRVYLPRGETGISVEMLREWMGRGEDPSARVPFIRAMRPLIERTRALFEVGKPLPRAMGSDLSPVVWLFGAGGMSVLNAVDSIGGATLWERPRLSKGRKVGLVGAAMVMRTLGVFGRSGGRR